MTRIPKLWKAMVTFVWGLSDAVLRPFARPAAGLGEMPARRHLTAEKYISAPPHELKRLERDINAIDLDCIKIKLMDQREGKGWTRERADHVETQYKGFLYLSATEPTPIVPSRDVDDFWHQHILDTRKYAEDCDGVFGYFVHHFPYFGMRGDEDARQLQEAFATTKAVYEQRYGEQYGANGADCQNCGSCQSTCGVCSSSCQASCGDHAVPDIFRRPSFATLAAAGARMLMIGLVVMLYGHRLSVLGEKVPEQEIEVAIRQAKRLADRLDPFSVCPACWTPGAKTLWERINARE